MVSSLNCEPSRKFSTTRHNNISSATLALYTTGVYFSRRTSAWVQGDSATVGESLLMTLVTKGETHDCPFNGISTRFSPPIKGEGDEPS
jgi:hypothetical protein